MAKASSAVPEGHHTVTPSLILDDAAQAIDWYKRAGYTWSIATHKEDFTPQEMKRRQDELMKQFATSS